MVKAMHAAGIEVILDVVYNHTAEGNHLGPTLSFKGIDNPAYYRLVEDDQRYYMDYTGTGNSLNVRHPHSLQLIMDSLRYWVTEMHVDGFRFDLASDAGPRVLRRRPARDVLRARAAGPGRQPGEADRRAVGHRPRRLPGRQLPAAVDRVERRLPRHRPRLLARRAVARRVRLAGSPAPPTSTSTPAAARSRASTSSPPTTASRCATWCPTTRSTTRPTARTTTTARATTGPGTTASRGRPTTPRSSAARAREQRNFLATLLLSQGVPMLLHGDELGRTQDGNNNTYAQDSEISWVHWDRGRQAAGRVHRRGRRGCGSEHPTFRRKRFFTGSTGAHRRPTASGSTTSSGCTSTAGRWRTTTGRAGRRRSGCTSTATASPASTPAAQRIVDDHFLLYFNADGPAEVTLPPDEYADAWDVVIDTGGSADDDRTARRRARRFRCETAACVVLREHSEPEAEPDHSVAASVAAQAAGRGVTRDAGPDQHLPAADHRGVRPVRGRRGGCPTCTTSASTGSTSRRCSRPSPAATTGTTWSRTTAIDPARGGAEGLAALSAEARRLGHGRARRHRAQPRRRRHPAENAWWWDLLAHGRESAHADCLRRRLGRRRRPDPDPGASATTTLEDGRIDTSRSPTASCATTTTASRSRPARDDARPDTSTTASTTSS